MRSVLAASLVVAGAMPAAAGDVAGCGTRPGLERDLAALHALRGGAPRALSTREDDRDAGDVAVIVDRGDLVIRRNPFDLAGESLRLTPRDGGYAAARVAVPIEPPGTPLPVADGGAHAVGLGFAFPFFGRDHGEAFVHADGHVTFGAADPAGDPGLGRFVDGPPRIAAFLARFEPSRGGAVTARLEPGRAVFLWSAVPGAGQINRNTFQVALFADGRIDLAWGALQTREGVVGLTPGGGAPPAAVDWTAGPDPGPGALAERFSDTERLDLLAAVRRFLAGHADAFHQVVVYTTRPLNPAPGTLAFEVNVRNGVRGIGVGVMDHSREWGSAGVLESVVYMDSADTFATVDAFEFLAHEVGHRWLARLRYEPDAAAPRAGLLGRGDVHWSFFLDSDASVMEGNAITDRGGGAFETVDFARRFSALDQYAMGLRAAAEVPPFFVVADPDDFRPARPFKASSAPEAGVRFTGIRREVHIEDVVRAMGPRVPAEGPPVFRQAFVLVADGAAPASEARIAIVERIRSRFAPYFHAATGGRGAALSTLR
jgi:hypothetical protein